MLSALCPLRKVEQCGIQNGRGLISPQSQEKTLQGLLRGRF